jgi:hypothetical protein
LPVAAAVIVLSCTKQPPNAIQEGARLMAQLKAASGGAALDAPAGFHETGTFVRDGVSGKYETWGDLRALRSTAVHTIDKSTFTSGFDGQRAWSVGPDGVVRMDTSPEGVAGARLGTYITIFAFFYPDRFPARFEYRGRKEADGAAYDVVTAAPADTPPVDLWLETRTHRLQRITGAVGTATFTAVVKRYQIVDGAWVPFSLTQTEGEHRLALELESLVYEPIPPERFAPPAR